ncbi:MAG: DUF5668 domain-containing protein [Gammaproteobacteria bacterium]
MAIQKQIRDPRYKSPAFAGFLSVMPGLGQIYVGYYNQGFTNVFVAGGTLSFLIWSGGDAPYIPLGIVFLIFFELFNIIDAFRKALFYNLILDGVEDVELPDQQSRAAPQTPIKGSYVGGVALLVFGVVALSNTAFGLSLDWVESWWPLVPIAFGAYLLYLAWNDAQEEAKPD